LYGPGNLDLAEVPGGQREHRASSTRWNAIDQCGEEVAAETDGARRRTRVHVSEDRAPERCGFARRRSGLADPVDVVHHDRVARIPARFRERPEGERILVEQLADRVVQA
jgi:hypothetical protein